jgi:hypothetical protein
MKILSPSASVKIQKPAVSHRRDRALRRILRENGLSLVLLLFFSATFLGHAVSGHHHYNQEQQEHGRPAVSAKGYLSTGDFWESLAENWESEFLQMAFYVFFTMVLYQKGSAESKDPYEKEEVDEEPREAQNRRNVPWPVRRGGWVSKVYEHSLCLAFLSLFFLSFWIHAAAGVRKHNEEERIHGQPPVPMSVYLRQSEFWFQSFQNWQSEFLAVLSMVVLSIFLRQKGSPQSKPVDASHEETGK